MYSAQVFPAVFLLLWLRNCSLGSSLEEPRAGTKGFEVDIWLRDHLKAYPLYALDHIRNPLPLNPKHTTFKAVNLIVSLEGSTWDFSVSDFVKTLVDSDARADRLTKSLSFNFSTTGGRSLISVGGKYKLQGCVYPNIPIKGEGTWRIRYLSMRHTARFSNVKITSDDYISISDEDFAYSAVPSGFVDFDCDGDNNSLFGIGEETMRMKMEEVVREEYSKGPMRTAFFKYFKELFKKNTFAAITEYNDQDHLDQTKFNPGAAYQYLPGQRHFPNRQQ